MVAMAPHIPAAPQYGAFYGQVTRRRELPDLTVTETIYPPCYDVPVHRHQLPWFAFVLEGSFVETFGSKSVECKPLTLLYRLAEDCHGDRSGERGGRCITVEMKKAFFEQATQCASSLAHSAEFEGGLLPMLALRLHDEFTSTDSVAPLAIEGLTLELVAESSRRSILVTSQVPPIWIKRAVEMVRERFREDFSLADMASELGIHPVQLARTFRKHYGSSVGEYVRKLRVEYAYNQLMSTDLPIVDIGLAAGFCDQAHFGRIFKRLTGLSPKQLRVSSRSRFFPYRSS